MEPYVVYCFLGMAETEQGKVFLWPQWERCFRLFDPLLKPFAKSSFIESSQAYVIPLKSYKSDPPGTQHVTFKSVRLGRLRWTYADNRKWAEKPLEKGEYPIRMIYTRIVSSNSKTAFPEIQISVFNRDTSPGSAFNQILTLTVAEGFFGARPAEYWDGLVNELAGIVRAVRIGRTTRPWWLERPRGNYTEGSSLADHDFSTRFDSLELNDSWQTWEYLK